MNLPDWSWGVLGNAKLREMFNIKPEDEICNNPPADYFIDYLINEISVADLVGMVLSYTPNEVLLEIADAIGSFEQEEV